MFSIFCRESIIGRFLLFFLAAAILFISCEKSNVPEEEIPLRSKIAQMLVVGFRGTTPQELEQESMGAKYYIQTLGVGGVCLFNIDVPSGRTEPRNIVSPEQLRTLTAYLHSLSDTPLMISIDQEGGNITRLREDYGFPATVTAQYLGTQPVDSTIKYSHITAKTLVENLINVNFAPCIDVNVNPDSPAIGARGRSYSSDPDEVTKYAGTWIDGHHDFGILTAAKHFPGHGSAAADSHLGMTDVTNTWQEYELQPYRDLIDSGKLDMVMTSHVFNQNLDSEYPASMSKAMIDGILRKQLGYRGLVISDDLNMNAIVSHYSLEKAYELSINAGTDMLIISNNGLDAFDPELPLKAVNIIERLVNEGKISQARIDDSYQRIMVMKSKLKFR